MHSRFARGGNRPYGDCGPVTGRAPEEEQNLSIPQRASQEQELEVVLHQLKHRVRDERMLQELGSLLAAIPAEGELAERAALLESLVGWLRGGGGDSLKLHRLRVLVEVLRASPGHAAAIGALLAGLSRECDGVELLAESGFASAQGFVADASDRVLRKCLPQPRDPRDLGALVSELFPSRRDAAFFAALPLELVEALSGALDLPRAFSALRDPALDAMAVLAARACTIGVAPGLRERASALVDDPFLKLPRAVEAFAVAARANRSSPAAASVRAAAAQCTWGIAAAHERMDQTGVSVDRVWRLERAARLVERLGAILATLTPGTGCAPALALFSALIRERAADRSLTELCRGSLHTLARKVVERNGESGEHYITATRTEWHALFSSAAGGGLLTALTVLGKVLLHAAALPLFFDGAAGSANYALSFLLMHLLGFTLATKQPAMTAAALAQGMRGPGPARSAGAALEVEAIVDRIARLVRSQLAAILGNLSAVIPAVLLLDLAARFARGAPILDAAEADHLLRSLHPLHSATLPFAVLTGALLFLGSLGAGWFENWVVLRRLPEAIAQSRAVRRRLGAARAQALGSFLSRHAAGIGGSAALGVLLGAVPAVSRVFGLGLEVRHVTLSTGTLALAASALGPAQALSGPVLWALCGIAGVAVLNLSVSFSLALWLALRSQAASRREQLSIARALLSRLRRDPWSFLVAPAADQAEMAWMSRAEIPSR